MSTVVTLGPVGFKLTGAYNNTREYKKLDVVTYQGSSYVAISDSIGQLPTNTEYWNCIAEKGSKGDPGAIKFEVVQTLPTTDIDEDAIYLVPITPDTQGDNYEEYIYVNNQWELLGKIGVTPDLSNYYTKTETNSLLNDKVSFTDYASNTKSGVIKAGYFSFGMDPTGFPKALSRDYNYYTNTMNDTHFISKGTLENVITGKNLETTTNKVTSLSSSSTDTQYPSAKCVYDSQASQDALIGAKVNKSSFVYDSNTETLSITIS